MRQSDLQTTGCEEKHEEKIGGMVPLVSGALASSRSLHSRSATSSNLQERAKNAKLVKRRDSKNHTCDVEK